MSKVIPHEGFNDAGTQVLRRFERGQIVYSRTHGVCVYLGVKLRAFPDPELSEVGLRLPFSRMPDSKPWDDHDVTVLKRDIAGPHDRKTVVDMITSLQDRARAVRALENRDYQKPKIDTVTRREAAKILPSEDVAAIASAVYRLHYKLQATKRPAPKLTSDYEAGLDRLAGILVATSLVRRRNIKRQPSETLDFFEEARRRIASLMDWRFTHLKPESFLEFDPRSSLDFATRTNVAKTRPELTAIFTQRMKGTVVAPQPATPAPEPTPVMETIAEPVTIAEVAIAPSRVLRRTSRFAIYTIQARRSGKSVPVFTAK